MMKDWICSQCGEWHSDHPSGRAEKAAEAGREKAMQEIASHQADLELEITRLRARVAELEEGGELVARLRNKNWLWTVPGALREEAADEITRLRAQLALAEKSIDCFESDRVNRDAELARLRASEKALLEALETITDAYVDLYRSEGGLRSTAEGQAEVLDARAAIAKATAVERQS